MRITIVGGGNVGTQFAVHCAEKKHDVIIFTRNPNDFSKILYVVDKKGSILHKTDTFSTTDRAELAFSNADIVFVTVPAFAMQDIANSMLPYSSKKLKIVLVPGTGGGEWIFKNCVLQGAELFGLQRVLSVARLVKYGESVCATGYRNTLYCATLNSESLDEVCSLFYDLFEIPCKPLLNYLAVTLTPSNPILHTSRLYNLFKNYKEGVTYDKVPLFYEDWNDETSSLLLSMDYELQEICKAISAFDLSQVRSLKLHYESETPKELTTKIRSIEGFKGLYAPVKKLENGFVPDFSSRYFRADFPFGLSIIVQIAQLFKVDCPSMQRVLAWYKSLKHDSPKFSLKEYGATSIKKFNSFYKDGF